MQKKLAPLENLRNNYPMLAKFRKSSSRITDNETSEDR